MSSGTQNLSTGESPSELRERKKTVQSSGVNGIAVPILCDDDAKKDPITLGRTLDGTGGLNYSS